jgi:hypothetical protein
MQRINETKRWFFENINKIDKPLTSFTKMRNEKTQINKIINEKEETTTPSTNVAGKTGYLHARN